MPQESSVQPLRSLENTQALQPRPEPKPCEGCGNIIEPFFRPRVGFRDFTVFEAKWCQARECEECSEKRLKAEIERDEAKIQSKENAEKEKRLLALCDVLGGKRALSWTFANFNKSPQNEKAVQAVKSAIEGKNNVYLFGPCGVGKTHLATAAVFEAFNSRKACEFWKPAKLMRWMRVKDADEQEARIENLASSDIFVLDDLGIGHATEFYAQILYEIVDARYMREACGMIVTSNVGLDALAQKIGDDRLSSRLAGMCDVLEINGSDMRVMK